MPTPLKGTIGAGLELQSGVDGIETCAYFVESRADFMQDMLRKSCKCVVKPQIEAGVDPTLHFAQILFRYVPVRLAHFAPSVRPLMRHSSDYR